MSQFPNLFKSLRLAPPLQARVLETPVHDVQISRTAAALTIIANLAAFSACAWIALARNIHALFYHYDGSYMLVDVRNQLTSAHPIFEFSNDFLQSIGNLQFPQNARLLFFFWPIGWFSDPQTAKIATYLIIALIVFFSAYGLARLLSQSLTVAITAGWILGFVALPFVPRLFFYEILAVAPAFVVIVAIPVVAFWLISRAGRPSSVFADAATVLGLVALAFYMLAASPAFVPVLASGTAAYVVLALFLAHRRSELLRKLAILAAALTVMTVLRWPWYVLGLFLDSAPYLFPSDFSVVYNDKVYASILFQGRQFGRAGPLLVALSATGAVLSLRSRTVELRAAAWMLLALLLAFVSAGLVLSVMTHWIFPPPVYFEIAAWPLYAVFAAIALHRFARFVFERYARTRTWKGYRLGFNFVLLFSVGAIAVFLVMNKPPTALGYPFPPRDSPVVNILRTNIALQPDSSFHGRIATIVPIKPDAGDAWSQQSLATTSWAQSAGNDEMSVGLWYYRVPTLFEYNQFISPAFHALIKRALQRPPIAHQRNITVLSYPNVRVLKLLGVRYVLMPKPEPSIGEVRATEERGGEHWGLIELSEPNLATYSPTSIEVLRDIVSTLNFVIDESVDLTKRAVAREEISGPLTPLRSSALSMVDGDLHVVAESAGRSLVIVPVEFSHCISLHETHPGMGNGATLLRVDGLLIGIVFEHDLDAVLSFRIGPLSNPLCRWQDYQELQAMLR